MRRHEIKDEDWDRIQGLLPGKAGDPGVAAKDNRLFVNAVLWIAKTAAPGETSRTLRQMELRLEAVRSLVQEGGLGAGVPGPAGPRPGVAHVRLDRNPRPPAAGAKSEGGGQHNQALGRSRGGFSTKIHVAVNGRGYRRSWSSGGQEADITYAEPLIAGRHSGRGSGQGLRLQPRGQGDRESAPRRSSRRGRTGRSNGHDEGISTRNGTRWSGSRPRWSIPPGGDPL